MEKSISTWIGGETSVDPVRIMSASPKVAYYIDSQEVEGKRETHGSDREDAPSSRCLWGYKVRMEATKRLRTIKGYLFFINHAF